MFDKEYFLRWHKDKTVAELRVIMEHNAAAIYSQNEEGARMLLAESQACAELVQKKNAASDYIETEEMNRAYSLPTWERANDARRKKAVHNLPAATSYRGQLVIAVLEEEDNLTAEEIRQWSDELSAMDNDEYKKLLDALCGEEILYCTNDSKYAILSFCSPDLQRTNPMLWLKLNLKDRTWKNGLLEGKEWEFFQRMIDTKKPVTEVDWIECTWIDYRKKQIPDNPKFHYGRAKSELSEFVEDGILSITPISDSDLNYYYFTMLGEKEGK